MEKIASCEKQSYKSEPHKYLECTSDEYFVINKK